MGCRVSYFCVAARYKMKNTRRRNRQSIGSHIFMPLGSSQNDEGQTKLPDRVSARAIFARRCGTEPWWFRHHTHKRGGEARSSHAGAVLRLILRRADGMIVPACAQIVGDVPRLPSFLPPHGGRVLAAPAAAPTDGQRPTLQKSKGPDTCWVRMTTPDACS